ncbi:MAG: LON peptidase substrate-binding domain-containing protein [Candidatus Thiodiazotropha sp. (ex Lucina aurantia)]|uniref:LON peptidase substrate-binding domain-containing protein n=1 Tax=Candidatus Thiodiazotropha taylori TaxID=2792791 RepID=A0A9E4NH72_9GAMM|nr:LON peptidase substrate-binding domain-containing protein [Candidatus Thiodiazotropha sp. (ex Lucina pensylvanica)]MBT3017654.1 LON peptidase substrate-binding domain-containing protein [Candidatus Thiodiazotropha taylori]MBT3040380.1 LON peptidase substrate-binding domain-containing protein [Candidatus Thiodiazotropha sp. (ex Codakia orbicularis)]MBV2104285.1 LON peptidase substrate-binding domain-containing protein [Candidatus Thiodiazotropha sp. (ex Lucina aurantia)]MCG7861008.1 LON pepti
MQNPFIPDYLQLPSMLPIFPLSGAVVMPGAQLPLNIFEPRYLNMVQDALGSHHLIGMIQPDDSENSAIHQLHTTGCAARISFYNETLDGRIEIIITGVCRFDIQTELPSDRGYRLIKPNWERFESDYDFNLTTTEEKRNSIYSSLDRYLTFNALETDTDQLKKLTTSHLVNVLTTALPLSHEDKQSILDAVSFDERFLLLMTKLEMASSNNTGHLTH